MKTLQSIKQEITPKQCVALRKWCEWYSQKLDVGQDYSCAEDDLFESFGCTTDPFDESKQ